MKLFYFLMSGVFYFSSSYSQSFKYKNYKYEWPVKMPAKIVLDSIFKNEDAVILEESCIYNEGGNKIPEFQFLNYSANYFFVDRSVQGANPVVKKYKRIKFLTQKGIDKFNRIILPESFDPSSDYYNVRPNLKDSILRPLGEFECIRYFAARIIKEDGTIKKATIKESTKEEIIYGAIKIDKYYNWIFQFTDLQPGDEVEMDYSYEGEYNYGKSNRIFFNADMPIQKLNFTFRYPEKEFIIMTFHNGAYPKDSIMVTQSSPHYTEYYFHFVNLRGGINDVGGRPYKQLPYFSFYRHRRDYGIEDSNSGFIKTPLPYPWSLVMLPYVGYKYENLTLKLSKTDRTTVALNEITEKLILKAGDTASAFVISKLQEDLAENYDFKEDPGYYMGEASDIENLGKNLDKNIIRQMSRIRIYDEVMLRLDKPFYHTLLTDKRISEIDMNRYETLVASRVGIAVPYQNFMLHFYPKSYRFGYEPNELPFYYEDSYSILFPQDVIAEKKYELVPRVEFKFIKTPSSDRNNNLRNTSGMVNISLDSLKVNVQAKIRLSGQFSTLIRGFYKYGSIDTTINPSYFNIISGKADKISNIKTIVSPTGKKFPFETTVNHEFQSTKYLTKTNDKTYSISLQNLFNNITEDDLHSENRLLNYYPDFQSQDTHRFLFHFDHPVEVTNIKELNKQIENTFSDYEIKASQPTPNDVLLETSLIVKTESVPASKVSEVEQVFNTIRWLNNSALTIRKTD